MKSYTTIRNLYGTLTNNNAATNLTLGDQLINDAYRGVCVAANWDFMQTTATASTVSAQQYVNLPSDYDKLVYVSVTIGTTKYTPREATSREMWDMLNQSTNFQSNTPEWFFIDAGRCYFFPTPSSATTDAVTFSYRKRVADLAVADYTTGTVSALTSGATTVTGSGTTWTAPMIGRWIKIDTTNTAGASGDGMWYQIATVVSATSLTLTRAYAGATISAGTTYTIGQMSLLPEAYQDMPLYKAISTYFASVEPDAGKSDRYMGMYTDLLLRMKADHGSKTISPVVDDGMYRYMISPNLVITL